MWHPAVPSKITTKRARAGVAAVAFVLLCVKLWLASTTVGTNDVITFEEFAKVIGRVGPVGIYGVKHPAYDVYNHPPLTGDMLWVFYHLSLHRISFPLLIRLPATLADAVTSLLVFELVRARRGDVRAAMLAGMGAAASPILVIISGFHGNTDPVFVMFILLSVWLLAQRELPLWAGVALGLGLSVKVVPLVVLPVLLFWALLRSRRTLVLFAAGLAVTLAVLWGPSVLEHWTDVRNNVLEYNGWSAPQWGLAQFLTDLGLDKTQLASVLAHARTPVVALSALLGMFLVWRRREALAPAVGLALACLLMLSTATGTQYLAWAAAVLFLADVWTALIYNLVGGLFLLVLYTHWSHGGWNYAVGRIWSAGDTRLAMLAWAALITAVVCGVRGVLRLPTAETTDALTAPTANRHEDPPTGGSPEPQAQQGATQTISAAEISAGPA